MSFISLGFSGPFTGRRREYVPKLRVNYACKELALRDNDLAGVALAAGFADQSHFTRVFKNVTGITPGVYRQIAMAKQ